ncbi:hypothetical protein ACQY0O_005136 [Thecaphora frezii]
MPSSHPDLDVRISRLLASLLVLSPPTLAPHQISPNLAARLRLLSLPSLPPAASDLPPYSSSAVPLHHPDFLVEEQLHPPPDDSDDARLALAHWLCTDLYPSSNPLSNPHRVATALFRLRNHLASSPRLTPSHDGDLNQRVVKRTRYADPEANHVRVRLDLIAPADDVEALTLLLVLPLATESPHDTEAEKTCVQFENILPTESMPEAGWPRTEPPLLTLPLRSQLHLSLADAPRDSGADPEAPQDAAAEYINDADDFWAGFSDDEDEARGRSAAARAEDHAEGGDAEDAYWASYGDDSADAAAEQQREQIKALKEENRGLRAQLQEVVGGVERIRDEAVGRMRDAPEQYEAVAAIETVVEQMRALLESVRR